LLGEVAEEAGATLLVATHDDRLRPHFTRILTLADGKLVA
jgi:putative ABC transport system ATP-binding protein